MDKTKKTGMSRRGFMATATATAGLAALEITIPSMAHAQTYPARPLTLVVMYSAGGGTDTVMRKLAEEMAKATGWKINVTNKPGAVGGVATQFVSSQRADGYTLMGAANYNRFVRVLGHADFVPWEDWVAMKAANSIASWSVRKDSPFQTMEDVIAAAKANPGSVTLSTSGTGGVWHELALIVSDLAGVQMKYVPYKGGKPASLAGLQGETDVAGGGLHEHIDLIRAGEFRNLCQTSPADITLEDGKVLRSIGGIIPESQKLLPIGSPYCFMMRRDLPPEVLQALADAFRLAADSDGFKEMLESRFIQQDIRIGEEADREAALQETITVDIFNRFQDQMGAEVKTAAELGLPAPADFDTWWPPQGYKPAPFK
jgi:tripartite-type tricarboxylate transporter receptor subunit TctC